MGQLSGDEVEWYGIVNRPLDACYEKDPNVVSRELGGERILVPITKQAADMAAVYVLNEVGASIWELLDGKRTLADITGLLLREYEVGQETVEADIFEIVDELGKLGMLRVVENAV